MANPSTFCQRVFNADQITNRMVDLLHGATGLMGGHVINRYHQWLHPVSSKLSSTPFVSPMHGFACGFAFVAVDHLARFAFSRTIRNQAVLNKPIVSLVRMAISVSVTALIMAPILHISITMAAALIATSIIGNLILLGAAKAYEGLVNPPGEQRPPNNDRRGRVNNVHDSLRIDSTH